MLNRRRDRTTFANVMSVIAVFIAIGGSAWAVSKNSVGPKQIAPNAVRSSDVKNQAMKGVDVAEDTFAQVPSAQRADDAQSADSADSALRADLLDGLDSTDFLRSDASVNANLLDGRDSSEFAPASKLHASGRVTMTDATPGNDVYTEQPILTAGEVTLEGWCAVNFGGGAEDRAGVAVDVLGDRSFSGVYSESPPTALNIPSSGAAGVFAALAFNSGNLARGGWATISSGNQMISIVASAEVNGTRGPCAVGATAIGP